MMVATARNLGLINGRPFAKPYRLTYERRPGYLYIHLWSDTISYEIARRYWNEIVVMLALYPSKRILVDKDIAPELSVADAFRMASEVAEEFRNIRVALCDRHADHRTIEFGDLVATNRGLNSKSFSNVDDAERWLLPGS